LLGTVKNMLYGWFLASLVGVVLGASVGISPLARAYLGPMLEFSRPLPASAIIPVAISLLGLTQAMVLTVIAFGALWPTLLATVHGFSTVEPRLYEVGQALRLTRIDVIRKIALPNAVPDIIAGMRLSLTTALVLAVVTEMLSSQQGLGRWILLAGRSYKAPDLFAGVILLGMIGFASSQLLSWAEIHVLRWKVQK
jgi:sulfonate transport system permease protein